MLKLHNTLTKKLETVNPINDKKINLFVCGPTVYDFSHIGHAKTYIQFDIIARYLKYRGYDVFYLQNITDVDDKIIQRAAEKNENPKALAQRFEEEYHKDMRSLNITSVTKHARATDHIPQIINQVKTLISKNYAYEIEDGVYFDLSKFPEYGKLSGRTSTEAEDAVSRIDESKKKRNKGDFCLWKRSKPGEPTWPSPWFPGRPGWHIEDTAITETFFGPQYDMHGGAQDLIFPHHEAEIAQMEAASGKKPLVKYWLHTGFLNVNRQKMSKSLGNFITIREALQKWDAQALRFLFASTHYRSPINFTEESLTGAQAAVKKLKNTLALIKNKIKTATQEKPNKKALLQINKLQKAFIKEMDNDFNTPKATAVLFELTHELNTLDANKTTLKQAQTTFTELLSIFGLGGEEEKSVPGIVRQLVVQREQARTKKDWKTSDELRKEIQKYGFSVDDTSSGTIIKKIK